MVPNMVQKITLYRCLRVQRPVEGGEHDECEDFLERNRDVILGDGFEMCHEVAAGTNWDAGSAEYPEEFLNGGLGRVLVSVRASVNGVGLEVDGVKFKKRPDPDKPEYDWWVAETTGIVRVKIEKVKLPDFAGKC